MHQSIDPQMSSIAANVNRTDASTCSSKKIVADLQRDQVFSSAVQAYQAVERTMSDNIDTRVSLRLDPGTWTEIEGYDDAKQFVGCVVNAMSYTYQTLGQLHDVKRLWDGNGAATKETAIIVVGKDAGKRKKLVLQKLDLADRDLSNNIAHTEKLLLEPLIEQAGRGSINGEVRSFVRGLNRSEREKFMTEALERDDEATLTAVLGAQCYLSGLTQLDHDHYLRTYHTKKRPDLLRRLDVMKRYRDQLGDIGPIINAEFEKAVGAKPSVVAHLARADAEAKAALAAEPTV